MKYILYTVFLNDDAGTENTMEHEFQEMGDKLPDIEPVVEDNWPNSIGRESEDTRTIQNK